MNCQSAMLVAAAAAGVMVAIVLHVAQTPGWDRAAPAHAGAVGELRQDLAALKNEMRALRSDVDRLTARSASGVGARVGTMPAADAAVPQRLASIEKRLDQLFYAAPSIETGAEEQRLTDPEFDAQAQTEVRRHFERLAARADSETVDPAWSADATSAIAKAFSLDRSVAQIEIVDCRATICRVYLANDPDVDIDEVLMQLGPEMRQTFPRLAVDVNPDRPDVRVLYLAAERAAMDLDG